VSPRLKGGGVNCHITPVYGEPWRCIEGQILGLHSDPAIGSHKDIEQQKIPPRPQHMNGVPEIHDSSWLGVFVLSQSRTQGRRRRRLAHDSRSGWFDGRGNQEQGRQAGEGDNRPRTSCVSHGSSLCPSASPREIPMIAGSSTDAETPCE